MPGPSLCSKKIESTPAPSCGLEQYHILRKLFVINFGLAPYNYKLSNLSLNFKRKKQNQRPLAQLWTIYLGNIKLALQIFGPIAISKGPYKFKTLHAFECEMGWNNQSGCIWQNLKMGFNLRILYCQYIKIWSDFHRDNPGIGPIHFVRKLLLFC